MKILRYFKLDLIPDVAVLGMASPVEMRRKNVRELSLTLLMYAGVWLGVIVQRLLELWQNKIPVTFDSFGKVYIVFALIVATAIFPAVFPKIFGHHPASKITAFSPGHYFVQFCLAFEQGFFWIGLIGLIAPK
jgi:hypothetical protein